MLLSKICAVVVTYNRLELLKECVENLCQADGDFDILIIDNSSTDGTEEFLKSSSVNYIRMKSNSGGAGGFFEGIKYAVLKGYDYVWVMDDDTIVNKESLIYLLEAAEILNGNFGFLSSAALWTDGEPCVMNIPINKELEEASDIEYAKKGIIRCQQASFVSLLLNSKSIMEIGLPIKEFFIGGDDIEYSNRISSRFQSYYAVKSSVCHQMKKNISSNIVWDDKERIERYYYLFRNRMYIARKKGLGGRIFNIVVNINMIRKILFSKADHKLKRISVILRGWAAGIVFKPQIQFVSVDNE